MGQSSGGRATYQKITSTPVTGVPSVKEYSYDENGFSTGEITNVPRLARTKIWQITGLDDAQEAPFYTTSPSLDQSYVEMKSDYSSSLYTSIGSVLTYGTVAETDGNGKTVYNYFKRGYHDASMDFHEEFFNYLGSDYRPMSTGGFMLRYDNVEPVAWANYISSRHDDFLTEDPGYWGTYYKHGTLKSKNVYNKKDQLVLNESYAYKDLNQTKITGLRVYQNPDIFSRETSDRGTIILPTNFYNTYCILVGLCQLTGKTTTQYDANGGNPVTTQEAYTYNDDNLLVQTKTTNSLNDTITTTNRYPADINTGVYSTMKQRNMLNYPIETIKKKNDKLTGSVLNTYQSANGASNFAMLLPEKVYQSKLVSPANSFTPFNGTTLDTSYQSSPEVEYLSYDDHGNPSEIKRHDGITTSYFWGYNKEYPIAEIKNAKASNSFHQNFEDTEGNSIDAYTGHKCKTGGYTHNLSGLDNGSYVLSYRQKSGSAWTYQRSVIQVTGGSYSMSLAGQVDDVCFYPADAQMSTYTYDPLIGMTAATDAKGETTFYDYDNFGRLYTMKDQDGHILKAYCYNYKGQATDCLVPKVPNIYARIEIANKTNAYQGTGDDSYSQSYGDVYIRFYSDAACTQPLTLSTSLSVDVLETDTYVNDHLSNVSTSYYTNTYNIPSGTSSYALGNIQLTNDHLYYDESGLGHFYNYQYDFAVSASPTVTYTAEPSVTN